MDSERWKRVKEVLEELLEVPPEERDAALARLAGDDAELRREVERFLARDSTRELRSPVAGALERVVADSREAGAEVARALGPGSAVGAYRIERRLGAGGMGEVYEATQESPRRRVALKLLPGRLHRESELSRFRYEAEVLGSLRHPGIAQVFEAGAADGVPFIAMELVEDARSVTEHARAAQLDRGARVALMEAVCAAVAYGHGKGVIHRDLKPSNLLVDSAGRVRVIDFGIARTQGEGAPDRTARTRTGEVVGTLAYMSPEQWEGRPEEVDAQSDVYSLGVVLYELLCGRGPYDLEGKTFLQASAIVTGEPPLRPRRAAPDLPEDLEWILLRALERDRSLRYASAAELGAELARFRRHEPVFAGPPSARYRVGKFVRRHRLAVAAGALVLASLVVGVIGLGVGLRRARTAERVARDRLEAERVARSRAEAISAHLRDLTLSVRSSRLGGDVRMVEALRSSMHELETSFAGQPEVEAELRLLLAENFEATGDMERARTNLERALELAEALPDVDGQFVVRVLGSLGSVHWEAGRPAEAERYFALAEQRLAGIEDWPEGELRFALMQAFRSTRTSLAGGVEQLEEVLARSREVLGPDDEVTLDGQEKLAFTLEMAGDTGRSMQLLEGAIERRERLGGPTHPRVLLLRHERAKMLKARGQFVPALEEVLALRESYRERFGVDSQHEFELQLETGILHRLLGEVDEAVALHRAAATRYVRLYGERDELAQMLTLELATSLMKAGATEEAVAHFEALAERARTVRADAYFLVRALTGHAQALYAEGGAYERAEALCREALEVARGSDAVPVFLEAAIHQILVPVLLSTGQTEEALAILEDTRRHLRTEVDEGNPLVTQIELLYGYASYVAGELDVARATLEACYRDHQRIFPGRPGRWEPAYRFLVRVYEELERPDLAEALTAEFDAATAAALAE